MYITSNDWSKDYLVQGIPCLVHLIFTWTGPSPAVQVDLVQGIHLPDKQSITAVLRSSEQESESALSAKPKELENTSPTCGMKK